MSMNGLIAYLCTPEPVCFFYIAFASVCAFIAFYALHCMLIDDDLIVLLIVLFD